MSGAGKFGVADGAAGAGGTAQRAGTAEEAAGRRNSYSAREARCYGHTEEQPAGAVHHPGDSPHPR